MTQKKKGKNDYDKKKRKFGLEKLSKQNKKRPQND